MSLTLQLNSAVKNRKVQPTFAQLKLVLIHVSCYQAGLGAARKKQCRVGFINWRAQCYSEMLRNLLHMKESPDVVFFRLLSLSYHLVVLLNSGNEAECTVKLIHLKNSLTKRAHDGYIGFKRNFWRGTQRKCHVHYLSLHLQKRYKVRQLYWSLLVPPPTNGFKLYFFFYFFLFLNLQLQSNKPLKTVSLNCPLLPSCTNFVPSSSSPFFVCSCPRLTANFQTSSLYSLCSSHLIFSYIYFFNASN